MAVLQQLHITPRQALSTIGVLILALFLRFSYRLYQVRTYVRRIAHENGIELIPHNFIFGHLIFMGKIMAKAPKDMAGVTLPLLIAREYPEYCKDHAIYLDTWPISADPMLVVFHPDMLAQFLQDTVAPKHRSMKEEFLPFTGAQDLVNQHGQEWKVWRSIFNPGFSAKNVASFMPAMVEELLVFKDWLKSVAGSGQVTPLEEQTGKLTIDVICRTILGHRMQAQTQDDVLLKTIQNQCSWIVTDSTPHNLLKIINPFRSLIMRNNNRIMKNYILPHVYRMHSESHQVGNSKTITELAMRAYRDETKASKGDQSIDPAFLEIAINQLKMFIFAGQETTASTICFIYHLLSTHQSVLSKLRTEHAEVFGDDPTNVVDLILESPHLLNQLPLTTAVIKETLRLFPPVGVIREGSESLILRNPDTGRQYPTKDLLVLSCSMALHHDPSFWPEPDAFKPERFLVGPDDESHPRKNAWRPFEIGPRACLGQELAMMEMRAVLALTIRDMDIDSVYDEGGETLFGDASFQITPPDQLTGHPNGGMPVRVTLRT